MENLLYLCSRKGFYYGERFQAWAGKSAKEYKKFKGLKKENLRDNMTNEELVLNMLAELSTTSITRSER